LQAIGKATELMFPRSGTAAHATFEKLLQEVTEPYRSEAQDPFILAGPEFVVSEEHIRPLAMALHELGTNAVKYGALSVPEGTVSVTWKVLDEDTIEIEWQEEGGPPVTEPSEKGLGSELLSRLLFRAPDTIQVTYEPAGVVCRIVLRR
jgi:two-component sensor histidine kinase